MVDFAHFGQKWAMDHQHWLYFKNFGDGHKEKLVWANIIFGHKCLFYEKL